MDQYVHSRLWRLVQAYAAPLGALLLIILVIALRPSSRIPQQLPVSPTSPAQQPTQQLVAKSVVTSTPAGGRAPVARTEHLVVYTSVGSYTAEQVAATAPEIEAALLYVQERTAMQLIRPVNIMFDRRPAACGLDAVAYTQVRTIVIYICPETANQRAVNVLAHELVHQLAHDHFGPAHLQADLIMSEGLATWGAGRYWLGDAKDFRTFVANNYGSHLLALETAPRSDESAALLNQLYYQWAAFIEWIIEQHGLSALEQLYAGGNQRSFGSAPYSSVLDHPMDELDAEWQLWVKSNG